MRAQAAGIGLAWAMGCGPSPTTSAPPPSPEPEARATSPAAPRLPPPARYVVLSSGAPLYDGPDAEAPRGFLADPDAVGGWTARVVDRAPGFVAVAAELDPTREHCAATIAGLDGLGLMLWVPEEHLATVIVEEVELTTDEAYCPPLIVRPGVMVTELCAEEGVSRFAVGSCPQASCLYEVPKIAVGREYEPGPRREVEPAPDEDPTDRFSKRIEMPCMDTRDDEGERRPHAPSISRLGGGMPAIALAHSATRDVEEGQLPRCTLSYTAGRCDQRPRLGDDNVAYRLEEGAALSWPDGTPAGTSRAEHRVRAVPREEDEVLCWSAVEGERRRDDVRICADPQAIERVEEAHAVIMQARKDGRRGSSYVASEATACYVEALDGAPQLQGRVRVRYRVEPDSATFEELDGAAPPGAEAFARCLAPHLADEHSEPHALDLVIDLHPPVTD